MHVEFWMRPADNVLAIIASLTSVLLSIKVYSFWRCGMYIRHNAGIIKSDIIDALRQWRGMGRVDGNEIRCLQQKHPVILSVENWPSHRIVFGRDLRLLFGCRLKTGAHTWLVSLPVLTCCQFVVAILSQHPSFLLAASSVLLLIAIWAWFIVTLYSRMKLGYCDNFLKDITASRASLISDRLQGLQECARNTSYKVYLGFWVVLTIAYGGIYIAITKTLPQSSFSDISSPNLNVRAMVDLTILPFGGGGAKPIALLSELLVVSHRAIDILLMAVLLRNIDRTSSLDAAIREYDEEQAFAPTALHRKRRRCAMCRKRRQVDGSGLCSECGAIKAPMWPL